MKKTFIVLAASALLFSCSSGPTTPCDCAQALKNMNTEYEEARGDEDKEKALQEKYEKLNKECEAIRDEMGQEKYNEELEKCMDEM